MGHKRLAALWMLSAMLPNARAENDPAAIRAREGDRVRLSAPPEQGSLSEPGEVHTVVPGDTLWDLSQRYLGSPWYWPKVWSYNPEIANPHWIYPGNVVRFFHGGEEAPARVEVGPAPSEMAEAEQNLPAPELLEEENRVHVSGQIGYKPRTSTRITRGGFLTPAEIEESGVIVDSFAQPVMLSFPDTVYIRFRKKVDAKVGDSFTIFHVEREIHHPVLGGKLGYLTKVDGTVKVIAVERGIVTAQIQQSLSDIQVGFLVGPEGEKPVDAVTLKANERQFGGYVVATLEPELLLLGEHHYIVVDKGSADGVQVGNSFTVVRQGKGDFVRPSLDQKTELPVEAIGTCVATDVKQRASTCVLTRSLREIVVGDRVVMQIPSPTGPVSSLLEHRAD